jgi:transcription initiation factor IIE alpha subunit
MLNYHLHIKVNELRKILQELWFAKHIKIDAKLYNREQHHFRQANLNTFYKESFSLN